VRKKERKKKIRKMKKPCRKFLADIDKYPLLLFFFLKEKTVDEKIMTYSLIQFNSSWVLESWIRALTFPNTVFASVKFPNCLSMLELIFWWQKKGGR